MRLRLLVLFAALLAIPALAADITGTWQFSVDLDGGGHGDPTFVLKQAGAKITGTFKNPQGESPVTGKPVRVMNGRYGPYITDGETNATLPNGSKPEAVTMDEALALLAARAEQGGGKKKKRPAPKAAAPKKEAAAKKAAPKKVAAKKAAPKKKAAG